MITDTGPEAARIQLQLLRKATPGRRLAIQVSLSQTVVLLARNAIRRLHPNAGPVEFRRRCLGQFYGAELAERLRDVRWPENEMIDPHLLEALGPVVDAFHALGVPYQIGGSVAAAFHGVPRSTLDVDIAAEIRPEQVDPFVERLQERYHIDELEIRDALSRCSSFNLIDFETGIKLDIFVRGERRYDAEAFGRGQPAALENDAGGRVYRFLTPEDVVLRKLERYRMGGEVTERQWEDVLAVLRIQAGAMEEVYLRRWAAELGVADLLERALSEAGTE